MSEVERLVAVRTKALENQRARNVPSTMSSARKTSSVKKDLEVDTTKERKLLGSQLLQLEPIALPSDIKPGSREAVIYRAERSGIMSVLRGLKWVELDAQMSKISFDTSDDLIESYGALAPGDVDKATGAWGHGIRKIGPGSGDGKDWGSVKTRGYKLATGKQRGDDYVAKALSRPRESAAPAVSEAAGAIIGSGLKYDVIRGQLGMRKRKLRRCFDLDETSDEGRPSQITMTFDITPSGEVGDVEASKVQDAGVRSCVENTLLSIHFPEPDDGKGIRIENFSLRI